MLLHITTRVIQIIKLSITLYTSVSQTFFKWGQLSSVRMFYGPPYSWDYQTH